MKLSYTLNILPGISLARSQSSFGSFSICHVTADVNVAKLSPTTRRRNPCLELPISFAAL